MSDHFPDAGKMVTPDLLPCPFCGAGASFHDVDEPGHPDFGGHFIQCDECTASVGLVYAFKDDPQPRLAEMWNAREARNEPLAEAVVRIVSEHDGWCRLPPSPTVVRRIALAALMAAARLRSIEVDAASELPIVFEALTKLELAAAEVIRATHSDPTSLSLAIEDLRDAMRPDKTLLVASNDASTIPSASTKR